MKDASRFLCCIAPIFPIYLLFQAGNFSSLFLVVIVLFFVALQIAPFFYLYRLIPSGDASISLSVYWLIIFLMATALGTAIYLEYWLNLQDPNYVHDAQEAIIFFIVPLYQGGIVWAGFKVKDWLSKTFPSFRN